MLGLACMRKNTQKPATKRRSNRNRKALADALVERKRRTLRLDITLSGERWAWIAIQALDQRASMDKLCSRVLGCDDAERLIENDLIR
jgi:hypothetical protein